MGPPPGTYKGKKGVNPGVKQHREMRGEPSTEPGGTDSRTGTSYREYNAGELSQESRLDDDPVSGRPREMTYRADGAQSCAMVRPRSGNLPRTAPSRVHNPATRRTKTPRMTAATWPSAKPSNRTRFLRRMDCRPSTNSTTSLLRRRLAATLPTCVNECDLFVLVRARTSAGLEQPTC